MGISNKIRFILMERYKTIINLSNALGDKGSNLYNKLRRDGFTESDCKKIADALDCNFEGVLYYAGY